MAAELKAAALLPPERSRRSDYPGGRPGQCAGRPGGDAGQDVELLKDVARRFRRQHVQLEQFPFAVYGLSLAAAREIAEHPGITVNELTGLPKSRVSVLMTRLAAQRIVRKDGDPATAACPAAHHGAGASVRC